MSTAIHLFLTESRHHRVLLGVYGACWVLFQMARAVSRDIDRAQVSVFLLWLAAAAVIVALCLSDSLVRQGAHWKIRPATRGDWLRSRILFIAVWLIAPVVVMQTWMAIASGLAFDTAALSVFQAVLQALAFAAVVTGLAVHVPNWHWMVGGVIGGMVVLAVGFEFPNPLETEAEFGGGVPSTGGGRWVVFWLGCWGLGIANVAVALAGWNRRCHFGVIGGSLIAFIGLNWWLSATPPGDRTETEAALSLTLKREAVEPGALSQQIYEDLHLRGLGPGMFGEITALGDPSGVFREKERQWGNNSRYARAANAIYAQAARISLFPREIHLWGQGLSYRSPDVFEPAMALESQLPDGLNLEEIVVRAECFEWTEVLRLPARRGAKNQGTDFSGEVLGFEREGQTTEMVVRFQRPALDLAPRLSARESSPRWRGFDQLAGFLVHEELGEVFLLSGGGYLVRHEKLLYPFSAVEQNTIKFRIPRSRAWRILWPNIDDDWALFQKWSEGAELRVFTTRYVGPAVASFKEG